jgi:hypothetical protein
MIPWLVLVRILASRIYKGDRDPHKTRSSDHPTPKGIQTTIHDIGYYAPRGPNLSKFCVPCTFEFLISVSSHLKLTTLGISLGGQPVKHRQLACQVGECIEDPLANSMASFQFTRSLPSQGTTFIFGSWVVADGEGDFRCFFVDMKPKTPMAFSQSDLDKFVDDLDDLSICGSATRIEEESASSTTSSGAAIVFLGLDLFQSENSRSRSRLGQRDLATDLQEANGSESLSILEEDLDSLLQKSEATVCRGALGCFGANSLITSTPEGRFVHWKGMSLFDLLEADDRLVVHLEPWPFQEGRPLATVAGELKGPQDA